MAKTRNSRSKSKIPAVAPVAAPQQEPKVVEPAPVAVMTVTKATPSHDDIARRAYELWLQRGAPHGTHLEDWLSAERELGTHAA